jgi:hypothetical protein
VKVPPAQITREQIHFAVANLTDYQRRALFARLADVWCFECGHGRMPGCNCEETTRRIDGTAGTDTPLALIDPRGNFLKAVSTPRDSGISSQPM